MKDILVYCAYAVIMAIVITVVVVPASLWYGWVMLQMWEWFVMPLGAPRISLAHAMALAMILHIVSWQSQNDLAKSEKTNEERFKHSMMELVFRPLVILIVGWILQKFI